jgi:hypothetical protein
MDPRLYLQLADALAKIANGSNYLVTGKGEVESRATAGRAYYAAFLVARDFLRWLGFGLTNGGNCHLYAQYALNNSGHTILKQVSTHLKTLYDGRASADYNMGDRTTENPTKATAAVALSRLTITLIDTFLGNKATPPLNTAQVSKTIQDWITSAQAQQHVWKL